MRSEQEVRAAIEQLIDKAAMAKVRGDESTFVRICGIKGALAWACQEDSNFGQLLQDWENIDERRKGRAK